MISPAGDETRSLPLEMRVVEGEGGKVTLSGRAVPYGSLSNDLGGFREQFEAGALKRTFDERLDVFAFVNHDPAHVLGRSSRGTLRMESRADGLFVEIDPPATSYARDTIECVKRGDVAGLSIAFRVLPGGDRWDHSTRPPTRTILDCRLVHLSPVSSPAYPQTDISIALRSLESSRMETPPPLPSNGHDTEPLTRRTEPTPIVVEPRSGLHVPPMRPEVESRMLGRDENFRTWIEERSTSPRDYAHVRLGDVLRAMVTGPRNDLERRVLAEGADSSGGISVPDITLAPWIDRLRVALVVVSAGATTIPLTSDLTKIARLASDPVAAWRSENAAVVESDPAFEGVSFIPRSLDVFFKTSRELLEDSINIAEMLEATLVRSFAVEVDRVCLAGTGTAPQPRGLRTITNVNEVSQGAAGAVLTSFDPLLDLLAMLWADNVTAVDTAVMAPRTLAALSKLKESTTNAPLARPSVLAPWRFLQTANVSIAETQGAASTASTLYMGDWSQMYLGFRTTMQVETARELFRGNFQVGYFGHLRFDMQVAHPESFGRLIGIL